MISTNIVLVIRMLRLNNQYLGLILVKVVMKQPISISIFNPNKPLVKTNLHPPSNPSLTEAILIHTNMCS